MAPMIEILIGLAFLHFMYERILAPSFRLRLRLRIFALRDELRWLKINNGCSEEEFRYLDSAMNVTIRMLHRIDFASLRKSSYIMESNPALGNRVAKRLAVIEGSESPSYQRASKELWRTARLALFVNNGACFFYLVPIIGTLALLRQIKRFIKGLLTIPEGEIAEVIGFAGMGQLAPAHSNSRSCDI